MRKYWAYLFAILLMAVSFSMLGCGKTKIDLKDYVTISAEGYNGYGKVKCNIDKERFIEDYREKLKVDTDENDELSYAASDCTPAELFWGYCVEEEFDKSEKLSNGDVVKLKLICIDQYVSRFNCKVETVEIEYEVTGLDEVESFNPFENIEVGYDGYSKLAEVTISKDENVSELGSISFKIDKESELSNGDTITISADYRNGQDSFIEQYGKIIEPSEMKYEVSGLYEYITDLKDIPEQNINEMKKEIEDKFNSEMAKSNHDKEKKSFKYIGNIFLKAKDFNSSKKNILGLVYEVNIETEKNSKTYYYYVSFSNLENRGEEGFYVDLLGARETNNRVEISGWLHQHKGYDNLNELINRELTANTDKYECVNNITN